jgi:hypothetical protein
MRRLCMLVTTLVVASLWVTFVIAESAQAAAKPKYCKFWRVQGQTWYGAQGSYTLMFTLKMSSRTSRHFHGYADYSKGNSTTGRGVGVGSQLVSGGVNSEGVGTIYMNIHWKNGTSGQYNAKAVYVRRTRSGGLTAGLYGTTVDTTNGNGGDSARWSADDTPGGNWPLYCLKGDVVRR